MQKAFVLTLALALAANGQKIETEKSDRNRVMRLNTAANHLSVIELAEPVTEVAAGSSSYKIEWRGNKVFVQPLEPEATTNLFIWTASGRLTYELMAVHSIADAQFAIDQVPGPSTAKGSLLPQQPAADPAAAEQAKLASELLLASRPVRLYGDLKRGRVQVLLKDVYRNSNRIYVRYAIQNDGRTSYQPGSPDVFALRSPRSPQSLYVLSGSQLAGDHARVTAQGQTPINVVKAETHASMIPPGGVAIGLIAFEIPGWSITSTPTVLRFAFPSDSAGDVTALLVL
jgi:hypothetical protein